MAPEGKNGFVRTIFWTLIIGSFGWSTFIGVGLLKAGSTCASEAKKDRQAIQEKVYVELKEIRKEQNEQTQAILLGLERLKTKIEKSGN